MKNLDGNSEFHLNLEQISDDAEERENPEKSEQGSQ